MKLQLKSDPTSPPSVSRDASKQHKRQYTIFVHGKYSSNRNQNPLMQIKKKKKKLANSNWQRDVGDERETREELEF